MGPVDETPSRPRPVKDAQSLNAARPRLRSASRIQFTILKTEVDPRGPEGREGLAGAARCQRGHQAAKRRLRDRTQAPEKRRAEAHAPENIGGDADVLTV
jgi:hypothetical protein